MVLGDRVALSLANDSWARAGAELLSLFEDFSFGAAEESGYVRNAHLPLQELSEVLNREL